MSAIYTDNNAIKCEIDWKIEDNRTYKEKFAKKVTKKGYQKFEKLIQAEKISMLWRK